MVGNEVAPAQWFINKSLGYRTVGNQVNMDYTRHTIWYKIRKALRYVRLYGLGRTVSKIRAQYHMRNAGQPKDLAHSTVPARKTQVVGILGCGNFAYSTIAYYLCKCRGEVIRGCMDIHKSRAVSLAHRYSAHYGTDSAQRVIDDPQIQLLYIASNHASHAEYAISALQAGKAVHIEKPPVVNHDQLRRLCNAIRQNNGLVRMGFNRPLSPFARKLNSALRQQNSLSVINWFVAGHELPENHWYFSESEGGRILGNLCHWTDFTLRMVSRNRRYPIRLIPGRGSASDSNLALVSVFADGSVSSITFSAMGHTFEGVRERLSVHCGDVIAYMDDFHSMTIYEKEKTSRFRLINRNHGHKESIVGTFDCTIPNPCVEKFASIADVWETSDYFLGAKTALETGREVTIDEYSESVLK
ncbi:MAG: Gfo/Idh/MocA family oxidoreductase [Steroidobacteraceae bacterium]